MQFPTRQEDYSLFKEISSGSWKHYPAIVTETNVKVSVEIYDTSTDHPDWDMFNNHIRNLRMMKHENIVNIYTCFPVYDTLWIVKPLMEAGSCVNIMERIWPHGFTDEILIATILKATLNALVYMHNLPKTHQGVKAGNILINNAGEIKLSDSRVADETDPEKNHQFHWMAPEVCSSESHCVKADIWSLGITAMEIAFGRTPYSNFVTTKVLLLTMYVDPPTIDIYEDADHQISKEFNNVIKACLVKDPMVRISARDLLRMNFFKKAKTSNYVIENLINVLKRDAHQELFQSKVNVTHANDLNYASKRA